MAPRPSSLGFLGGRLSQESIKSPYIYCVRGGVLISLVHKALLSSYQCEGQVPTPCCTAANISPVLLLRWGISQRSSGL